MSRKFKGFFRPKLGDLQKKKKKKKKKRSSPKIQSDFSAEIQNSKVFSAQNQVNPQKKKKRSSPKFRAIFLPISHFQTFEGRLFSYGEGYFPFFTENRPQKHKKHAILHTSQANGGARAPPAPLWLRYWLCIIAGCKLLLTVKAPRNNRTFWAKFR